MQTRSRLCAALAAVLLYTSPALAQSDPAPPVRPELELVSLKPLAAKMHGTLCTDYFMRYAAAMTDGSGTKDTLIFAFFEGKVPTINIMTEAGGVVFQVDDTKLVPTATYNEQDAAHKSFFYTIKLSAADRDKVAPCIPSA